MLKRRLRLILVLGGIILGVFSFTVFARLNYCLPILMYHSVNPEVNADSMLSIRPAVLQRQMAFLKKHRYNVISLEEAADLIRRRKNLPARSVVLTFDDGYRDNYTYVFPILKKYNLPATLFIITAEVDRINPSGIRDRLSWEEIRMMRDSGIITFGSHALGPEPLVNIGSEDELRKQVFDSKKILEEKIGRKINTFSYPEGEFNAKIKQLIIDAGYKAAVATNPGKNYSNRDVFALKRLRISANCNNLFVFWVETSGLYIFMKEHRHHRH